jgi:hypothetical protein
MRTIFIIVIVVMLAYGFAGCKSSSGPPTFCDTACLRDTIKFTLEEHPLKPYVYISAKNCIADTLIWSYIDMGINRKLGLPDLAGAAVRLNKDYVSCFIKDTSYAWLSFNDCSNGRGYILKIPFNKKANIIRKGSAINALDPKFAIAEGLVAWSDKGNLFVEEMVTGKTAMMTFGQKLDIDYDAIHETIDSVSVTPTRIWAKVKLGENWKELGKNITLK